MCPEFICKKLKAFLINNAIEHKFIQPGKPSQNAYIERFNRTFTKDVLNAY
ncbi:MAG: transposase [Bacteroidetes bacterium]|nr:transposase [Bacteroidota bacterium]